MALPGPAFAKVTSCKGKFTLSMIKGDHVPCVHYLVLFLLSIETYNPYMSITEDCYSRLFFESYIV